MDDLVASGHMIAFWREGGYLLVILVPVFVAVFVSCAFALMCLGRLVRLEREKYPDAWERDGRPSFSGWRSTGAGRWSTVFANWHVSMAWLFRTPEWAENDEQALQLLRRMRLAVTVVWIGSFVIAILAALPFVLAFLAMTRASPGP